MRIRLALTRHSLGTVKLWWDTASIVNGSPNVTVSALLESVNQVVQLETVTCGLEDYVVEMKGYELLHFQILGDFVKEDDEIVYVYIYLPQCIRNFW